MKDSTQPGGYQMTALEQAAGTIFGFDESIPALALSDTGVSARAAIESVIREALQRPPCVVSFSGGRDSSAILALATLVARREGLPLPIPVSLRFPQCETSLETEWQELVVAHLGLAEWHRPTFTDELDLIGPISQAVLQTHGLLWPFNAYFHVPIAEAAAGGAILTGVGGDELFSAGWAWHRVNQVAAGRLRPLPLDAIRVPVALGPRRLRGEFLRRRPQPPSSATPWLRDQAQREIMRRRLAAASRESLSWSASVAHAWWPLRSRVVGDAALNAIAAEQGARCVSPLCAPSFLAAVARERGWRMFANRTMAMKWFVGDLLPDDLIARPSKAYFDAAFWNRYSRDFAVSWDGAGIDESIVDVAALMRLWGDDDSAPDARTFTLAQSTFLHSIARHQVHPSS